MQAGLTIDLPEVLADEPERMRMPLLLTVVLVRNDTRQPIGVEASVRLSPHQSNQDGTDQSVVPPASPGSTELPGTLTAVAAAAAGEACENLRAVERADCMYRRAMAHGLAPSVHPHLGSRRISTDAAVEADLRDARAGFAYWASAGNTHAKYRLAMMALLGEGGPQNLTEAFLHFEKSARQYGEESMFMLAVFHAVGWAETIGLEPGLLYEHAATDMYRLCALSHGSSIRCQMALAARLAHGLGTQRSCVNASKLYRKVALHRHEGWAAENRPATILADRAPPKASEEAEHDDVLKAFLGEAGAQLRLGVRRAHDAPREDGAFALFEAAAAKGEVPPCPTLAVCRLGLLWSVKLLSKPLA